MTHYTSASPINFYISQLKMHTKSYKIPQSKNKFLIAFGENNHIQDNYIKTTLYIQMTRHNAC